MALLWRIQIPGKVVARCSLPLVSWILRGLISNVAGSDFAFWGQRTPIGLLLTPQLTWTAVWDRVRDTVVIEREKTKQITEGFEEPTRQNKYGDFRFDVEEPLTSIKP